MATNNTIVLKGELTPYEEARAAGAVVPGDLVELKSTGKVGTHATAGGVWDGRIAIEDALQGPDLVNTRGNTIEDAYALDDLLRYKIVNEGEIVNLRLAPSQNIALGDKLTSNGDGRVKESNGTTDRDLFIAEEVVVTGVGETKRLAGRRI